MTKRIFAAILLVTVTVLLLSAAAISAVLYEEFEAQLFTSLKSEAHTIAVALESGLRAEDYLPALKPSQVSDLRVTWVAADGSVLYDSDADAASMENHLAREEIAEALQNGYGDSTRNSATISKKTIYYACRLTDGTRARGLYGAEDIVERHRHRFEFNNEYRQRLEAAGLVVSGVNPERNLVEVVELKDHPWFIGCQYHPEFKSRPNRPHPLFAGLVGAAIARKDAQQC